MELSKLNIDAIAELLDTYSPYTITRDEDNDIVIQLDYIKIVMHLSTHNTLVRWYFIYDFENLPLSDAHTLASTACAEYSTVVRFFIHQKNGRIRLIVDSTLLLNKEFHFPCLLAQLDTYHVVVREFIQKDLLPIVNDGA